MKFLFKYFQYRKTQVSWLDDLSLNANIYETKTNNRDKNINTFKNKQKKKKKEDEYQHGTLTILFVSTEQIMIPAKIRATIEMR